MSTGEQGREEYPRWQFLTFIGAPAVLVFAESPGALVALLPTALLLAAGRFVSRRPRRT